MGSHGGMCGGFRFSDNQFDHFNRKTMELGLCGPEYDLTEVVDQ